MRYDQTKLVHINKIGRDVPPEVALPLLWKRHEPKINKIDGGCWLWTGWKNNWGYGEVCFKGKNLRMHRLSYLVHKGPIPPKMLVCHKCDTPACCNPDHLWLGTNKENHWDARDKKRCRAQKITHCPKGHAYDEHGVRYGKAQNRACTICQRAINRIQKLGWPEDLAYTLPAVGRGYRVKRRSASEKDG